MSIRLHKEHGLNPTIPTCFFCGKQKNEIILLGAAYKERAPMNIGVINHEPCEECKNYMRMGIMLVSVKNGTDEKNPYRTGEIVVIKEEAATKIFNINITKKRFVFVEDEAWDKIGLPRQRRDKD